MEITSRDSFADEREVQKETVPGTGDSGLQQDATTSQVDGTGDSWKKQLAALRQEIEELQEDYEQSFLRIGKLLIQAREVYKSHGNWIKWLRENVPFSVRHAQRLIRVAEMFDDTTLVSQLGLTSSKAYILTRVSKDDIDHFLTTFFPVGGQTKSVKTMTRRELDVVVTNFLRKKLVTASHEETTPNQGKESPKKSVELNLERLKKVLSMTIASIKGSDLDTRDSWISELESLYQMGMEELTQVSK